MRLTDPVVEEILEKAMVARIATMSRNGRPHLNPLYFVVADGHVHLGTAGYTLAAHNVEANPTVQILFVELVGLLTRFLEGFGRELAGESEFVNNRKDVDTGLAAGSQNFGQDGLARLVAAGKPEHLDDDFVAVACILGTWIAHGDGPREYSSVDLNQRHSAARPISADKLMGLPLEYLDDFTSRLVLHAGSPSAS